MRTWPWLLVAGVLVAGCRKETVEEQDVDTDYRRDIRNQEVDPEGPLTHQYGGGEVPAENPQAQPPGVSHGAQQPTRTGQDVRQQGEAAGGIVSQTGTVRSVGQDRMTLELQDGREVELRVRQPPVVVIAGEPSSLADLQEGTQVRAAYELVGDERVLHRVEVDVAEQGGPPQNGQ